MINLFKSVNKKIRQSRGETILEVLCALLIIVLLMTVLTTSIVIAQRVNTKVKNSSTPFVYQPVEQVGTAKLVIVSPAGIQNSIITSSAVGVTVSGIEKDNSGNTKYYSYE